MRPKRQKVRPHLGYHLHPQIECQHMGLKCLSANQEGLSSYETLVRIDDLLTGRLVQLCRLATKAGANFIVSLVNFSSSCMHHRTHICIRMHTHAHTHNLYAQPLTYIHTHTHTHTLITLTDTALYSKTYETVRLQIL